MQYARCICGDFVIWHSGETIHPCQVCEKCGSVPASHPDFHKEPEPHQFELRYDEKTGSPSYELCIKCYKRRKIMNENNIASHQAFSDIEAAWGLIANAYGGDWEKASPEWKESAEKWRDEVWDKVAAGVYKK